MPNVAVVGAQWGDEGKGKIVDWLSERADVVARFQGGHNAGHTLVVDGETYKLSLLPAGVVRPGKLSVIGNGVVVDPWALAREIEGLRGRGAAPTSDSLVVADTASLILPLHGQVDRGREAAAQGARIGTTGRGIGPAYEDKIGRRAVRVCDLGDEELLRERVDALLRHHNALLRGLGESPVDGEALVRELLAVAPDILPYAGRAWRVLDDRRRAGASILFEGAQGAMLDVDHGTYPYVTSSNTVAGQAHAGCGFGGRMDFVLGLCKAYTTRVGAGPFPTERDDDTGQHLGERGHEFGTVTGRARRCGWFDAALARQAVTVAGIDGLVLTKLDVLDELDEIKIGVGYRVDGTTHEHLPASPALQARAEPVYETLPGWRQSTHGLRTWDALPANAAAYVERIEALTGARVSMISTSPERADIILRDDPFAA